MVRWSPSGEKKALWGSAPLSFMFLTEAPHGKQPFLFNGFLKHVIANPGVSASRHPLLWGKCQTAPRVEERRVGAGHGHHHHGLFSAAHLYAREQHLPGRVAKISALNAHKEGWKRQGHLI